MPARLSPIHVHGGNIAIVWGAFLPNGSGAITQSANVSGTGTGLNVGFTPAHSGTTGIYNIDLAEPYPGLVQLQAFLCNAVANKIEALTAPGALTQGGRRLQVRVSDMTGAAVDLAASANRYIQFQAILRRRVA